MITHIQATLYKPTITQRIPEYLQGVDPNACTLLLARRLVLSAYKAGAGQHKRAFEDARLSVGMQLAHIAQRLGSVRQARGGFLGFGAQKASKYTLFCKCLSSTCILTGSLFAYHADSRVWKVIPQCTNSMACAVNDPAHLQWATTRVQYSAKSSISFVAALYATACQPTYPHCSKHSTVCASALQAWVLPKQLLPMAAAMYQLQRGPLLGPSSGAADATAGLAWRLFTRQFLSASAQVALCMVCPSLYIYDSAKGSFESCMAVDIAVGPHSLAVLDCGTEVLVYAGEALHGTQPSQHTQQHTLSAAAAGSLTAAGQDGAANGTAAAAVRTVAGPQTVSTATASTDMDVGAAGAGANSNTPDLAVAASPAVQCAHQLAQGRIPVPSIHILDQPSAVHSLMTRLVPLHADPMELQLLLLPQLQQLTPKQHGDLLEWQKQWWGSLDEEPTLAHWLSSFDIHLPVHDT